MYEKRKLHSIHDFSNTACQLLFNEHSLQLAVSPIANIHPHRSFLDSSCMSDVTLTHEWTKFSSVNPIKICELPSSAILLMKRTVGMGHSSLAKNLIVGDYKSAQDLKELQRLEVTHICACGFSTPLYPR